MANGKQRRNGKAFEFAVLKGFYEAQLRKGKAIILESPEVELAMDCYDELRAKSRLAMDEGADAAVKLIMELEPQLSSPHGNDPLLLSLQPDNAGRRGSSMNLHEDTSGFVPFVSAVQKMVIELNVF